jgi:hypothetical protein
MSFQALHEVAPWKVVTGEEGRLCGVDAARHPSPHQLAGLVGQGYRCEKLPDLQVLTDLVDSQNTLNVLRSAVSL